LRDGLGLRDSVFEPHEIKAMSAALDEVCRVLELDDDSSAKEIVAKSQILPADSKKNEHLNYPARSGRKV
jgi:hypothetical protein